MLKPVPRVLQEVFLRRVDAVGVPLRAHAAYLKWLQFYLNFCEKYRHPPRDHESLLPFLQKLAAKGQSTDAQRAAAECVNLYYDVVKDWSTHGPPDAVTEPTATAWESCHAKLKAEIRLRQYSRKTFLTYSTWVRQFQAFVREKDPAAVRSEDARDFLTHLAVDKHVVASTQNQAFNALLFLYRHILKVDYDLRDQVVRARRTRYIPVVLSREEVDAVVAQLHHPYRLVVGLLYGCGLRQAECLNLRIQCFNFDQGILTIHDGKGRKDRAVPLPATLVPDLQAQMERVRALHREDLAQGYDGVFMPGASSAKSKSNAKEFVWQWFFPASTLTFVPDAQERRRYHLHETQVQRALHEAVRAAQVPKRVTCHTFRHTFASHLLRANYDIRTIQQLLGHSDIRTTMIYTHTVQSRTLKEAQSPLDLPAAAFQAPVPAR